MILCFVSDLTRGLSRDSFVSRESFRFKSLTDLAVCEKILEESEKETFDRVKGDAFQMLAHSPTYCERQDFPREILSYNVIADLSITGY